MKPARRAAWIALAAGAAAFVVFLLRPTATPVSAGRMAPRFLASTIDATPVQRSLDDYAGHPLLLNVWATWCDPCREEMPSLEKLQRDYKSTGLRVVAVSIDDAGQDSLIRDFVREHRLTFDILHDSKAAIMQQYQVRGVPQTFLVSRTGHVVATRFAADWSTAAYRALVDSLLLIGSP